MSHPRLQLILALCTVLLWFGFARAEDSPATFKQTVTGGIQDIAALLPLLGTEQCERHVGSALEGGFLYAAATPFSIFGSLGIVKIGISVLIASISIPKLPRSFRGRWLGARVLENAGFKPVGTVAPLIGMEGKRYVAETRLLQILEEKHIDNPENLSVEWRSVEWNIALIFFAILAAAIGFVPYIRLTITPDTPPPIHLPWGFPLLRTLGSCLAVVCCQFVIQSRVISLMKSRIVFMTMARHLSDELKERIRQEPNVKWDEGLPAEECLESLEQYFRSHLRPQTGAGDVENQGQSGNDSIKTILQTLKEQHRRHFPTPVRDRFFVLTSWILLLLALPASVAGYIGCFTLVTNSDADAALLWVGLEAALSVLRIMIWAWNPSFDGPTEVNMRLKLTEDCLLMTTHRDADFLRSSDTDLSLVPERTFLERITPYTGPLDDLKSPENTALYFVLTANGKHTEKRLLMTVFDLTNRTAFTLYSDQDFGSDKKLVYANTTVTSNTDTGQMMAKVHWDSKLGMDDPRRVNSSTLINELSKHYHSLLDALRRANLHTPPPLDPPIQRIFAMLGGRFNQSLAACHAKLRPAKATVRHVELWLLQATARRNPFRRLHVTIPRPIQTFIQLAKTVVHPFRQRLNLLPSLSRPYPFIWHLLSSLLRHRPHPAAPTTQLNSTTIASLPRKWSLTPRSDNQSQNSAQQPESKSLTWHDRLCLGYEYRLKTKLMGTWSRWIVEGIAAMRKDALNYCHHVISDPTSENAEWELAELEAQLVWEWVRRELLLLLLSVRLEDTLPLRIEKILERRSQWLRPDVLHELAIGRRRRLGKEKEEIKKRMDRAKRAAADCADLKQGRRWEDESFDNVREMWEAGQKFIEERWSAAIQSGTLSLENAAFDLEKLVEKHKPPRGASEVRHTFVEQLRPRFEHWDSQRNNELQVMEATINQIREADFDQLDQAYRYPEPSSRLVNAIHLRFVWLPGLLEEEQAFAARIGSATLYDAENSDPGVVFDVIKRSSPGSLINVHEDLIRHMHKNDHLLFISSPAFFGPREEALRFIQQNRERWWQQQTSNTSTFYFTPQEVHVNGQYVTSRDGTIARIMVFIQIPASLRLRLLHLRREQVSVSIQEQGNELHLIHADEIPMRKLRLQDFELGEFEPGRYELELVVRRHASMTVFEPWSYGIRDILVEFLDDLPSDPGDGGDAQDHAEGSKRRYNSW